MKKYLLIIFFIILAIFKIIEFDDSTNVLEEIEINEEIQVLKYDDEKEKKDEKKLDINTITYIDLINIGLTNKKAIDFLEYRDFIGVIQNFDEIKKIPNFSKKYVEIMINNTFIKDGELLLNRYDINELNEKQLRFLGVNKKEIEKFMLYIKDNKIHSEKDLEKVFNKKTIENIRNHLYF